MERDDDDDDDGIVGIGKGGRRDRLPEWCKLVWLAVLLLLLLLRDTSLSPRSDMSDIGTLYWYSYDGVGIVNESKSGSIVANAVVVVVVDVVGVVVGVVAIAVTGLSSEEEQVEGLVISSFSHTRSDIVTNGKVACCCSRLK